jgi:O-antigen ligase
MIAPVIAVGALTGPVPKLGVAVVALLAALALLAPAPRARAAAILAALVLAPVLLLSEIWSSPQLSVVHRHPLVAVVGAVVALAAVGLAARWVAPRRWLSAPLAALTLPFRVPIQTAAGTSNLLVPLYVVIAVAALAWLVPVLLGREQGTDLRAEAAGIRAPLIIWVERLLALFVVLYGLQATYSPAFETALQNMVFFYVPFALLYRLLRELDWTPALIGRCLRVTVALGLVFSLIGFYEYATKTIILSSKLASENDFHTYFTVNSVFLDPDIFGRYLSLVIVLLAVVLIYDRSEREQRMTFGVIVVLWACLVLTLSRSSLGALLVGMAVLAALRWRPGRALVTALAVVAIGAIAVLALPRTFGLNQGLDAATSGRGNLISGGLSLFADRPVWGYGSGSFARDYCAHYRAVGSSLCDSHTIPVTIAAEQGLIGELVYLAFVLAAIVGLLRGARGDPIRSAVAAAFIALVFHTLLYADFLEDPTTWVLLGAGLALSASPVAVASSPARRAAVA